MELALCTAELLCCNGKEYFQILKAHSNISLMQQHSLQKVF